MFRCFLLLVNTEPKPGVPTKKCLHGVLSSLQTFKEDLILFFVCCTVGAADSAGGIW